MDCRHWQLGGYVAFKDFLQQQMDRVGMGPTELARQVGVSHPSVIGWLNGATPRPKRIKLIANALGVTPEDIYEALGWMPEITDLTTGERRLLKIARQLSDEDLARLEQIGQLFVGERARERKAEIETA